MENIRKSNKLDGVLYDIRGPVLEEAKRLEDEGFQIVKLNTGNPAAFGFNAPDELLHDVIVNLKDAQGYCDSKGLFPARKAIFQYYQENNVSGLSVDDVFIGNGVSELIVMSMQALLNNGSELLIPSPDYPLWTAAVTLAGGKAVHYMCDEESDWYPDLEDIKKKITSKTKGILLINPNNPTGAVYPKKIVEGIVEIARQNNLIVFSDEIYDKILYDGYKHTYTASLADDIFFVTFGGLSKNYRAAGFRSGWMVLSGNKKHAKDYIEGLEMLANMRLCSNVPAQYAIQTSLGGYQSINELVVEGGRLFEQRNMAYEKIIKIPGISCVKPRGAMYLFPKIDVKKFNIKDDRQFVFDFLKQERVLLVQGTGFNWLKPDHFRVVFLPTSEILEDVMKRLENFLSGYKQQ